MPRERETVTCGLPATVLKWQQAIILHASGEEGFIPKALMVFKSGSKSGDCHGNMNFSNYEKWLKTKLIPNLPPSSVLVTDSASDHIAQLYLAS
jgi:hypothetical protein